MQAVAQGKWLVIEDLNLAPPEVLATLAPLLANRHLHLPQRAQLINAAPGFQLLASITTAPGNVAVTAATAVDLIAISAVHLTAGQRPPSPVFK